MEQKQKDAERFGGSRTPRVWSGLFLIIAGALLLAYKMGAPIPGWIFTWPVLLIAIGLLIGLKSGFRNSGSIIMILIGSFFLIDQNNPDLNFHNYIVPAILISIGLLHLLRPRNAWDFRARAWRYRNNEFGNPPESPDSGGVDVNVPFSRDDATLSRINSEKDDIQEFLEVNAVLGGVNKIVLSKDFRGGHVNCFMGGAEINLLKADIRQTIVIEISNVLGGTKLIVPSDWLIKNNVTAILGGIEDKRTVNTAEANPKKVVIIRGTCVLGGIEISSYH